MTINLPDELEGAIRAEVLSGQFTSEEELVAEAVRAYLLKRKKPAAGNGMGSIGAMRDAADDLDQAVEHAMQVREGRPWRLSPGE